MLQTFSAGTLQHPALSDRQEKKRQVMTPVPNSFTQTLLIQLDLEAITFSTPQETGSCHRTALHSPIHSLSSGHLLLSSDTELMGNIPGGGQALGAET